MFGVGLTIGLIGAGGAILTVPIMVYLFNVSALLATSYSLFIVGASSLVGWIRYHRDGLVDYSTATLFALPSLVGMYATRRMLLPLIPNEISLGGLEAVSKDQVILTVFSVVMLVASIAMIRGPAPEHQDKGHARNTFALVGLGILVGSVAGFIGAGGGFLIIPALVVLNQMPMNLAVGTSILIVATNSILGFLGDVMADVSVDWIFLAKVTSISMIGIVFGVSLSKRIEPGRLKKGFGWFVLANGCYVLLRQVLGTGG
ncbi:MAG: hypothetical protein RL011_1036 [Pseudomonadota bacterium]